MAETFWKGFPGVEKGLVQVRTRLLDYLERIPPELKQDLKPYFERGGKALRAGLVILAAQQESLSTPVVDCAAAIELLHLASLIHDDVVDDARLRRGDRAMHEALGIPKAVLYGDFLFSACFRLISQEVSSDTAQKLAAVAGLMAGSEIIQLKDRGQIPVSLRRLLKKTMGKTAVLFSLSLYAGAREAGRGEAQCRILRRAGYALGMAFQLQDDLLDWTGRESELGKPVLEDLRSGNYTLPVFGAGKKNPAGVRAALENVEKGLLSPETLAAEWLELGVFSLMQDVIDRYWCRAHRDFSTISNEAEQAVWFEVVSRLQKRKK